MNTNPITGDPIIGLVTIAVDEYAELITARTRLTTIFAVLDQNKYIDKETLWTIAQGYPYIPPVKEGEIGA